MIGRDLCASRCLMGKGARTPDGRAWDTCQFLPANFIPSVPLGFTFDNVACQQSADGVNLTSCLRDLASSWAHAYSRR